MWFSCVFNLAVVDEKRDSWSLGPRMKVTVSGMGRRGNRGEDNADGNRGVSWMLLV